MEQITPEILQDFLNKLVLSYPGTGQFYLLGGSALSLLGSPRSTLDIDYTYELDQGNKKSFEDFVNQIADDMKLDLESVPLEEFIPLPPGASSRRRFIGSYGKLDVYLFDLYSITLSKLARGFETDLEDVVFLLKNNLIDLNELDHLFKVILPEVVHYDINPKEFQQYFAEMNKLLNT